MMTRTVSIFAVTLAVAALAIASAPARLPEALRAQEELVATSPSDAGAINDLANLLVLAGDFDRAESAYRRAVTLDPYSATYGYNLGLLLQQTGRHLEAITELTRVVEALPDQAWAHYQLGFSYEALGKNNAAIRSYARAFSLDPRLAFADVNPQVIDSRLLTVSMLTAYSETSGRIVAPLSYREPDRIAQILLPPALEEALDESAEGGAGETGERSESADSGKSIPLSGPEQQRARSLARTDNLRSPPNRVSEPARDSGGDPQQEEDDDWWDEWPEDEQEAPDDEEFEPRLESTGRLDLRLLPPSHDGSDSRSSSAPAR